MCEQMIKRVSGQIQSPAGLVRVKKSDHVQTEVSLEPLHVRVSTVKYLRAGGGHTASTVLQKENSFWKSLVIFNVRS